MIDYILIIGAMLFGLPVAAVSLWALARAAWEILERLFECPLPDSNRDA